MATGFVDARIVQVHPTLRCNLACAHCYSGSGPRQRGELDVATLVDRLTTLRAEGYEVVSFSGGEPLMYGGFDEAVDEARGLGFRVNAISNGLLLTPKRVERLASRVSVLGLSVDGAPSRHDRMRGLDGAFAKLRARLELLREHDVPFGLSHCVTRESIEDLPWLLDYAAEQGARLLQLHPLTLAGRAATDCTSLALSQADLARTFLLAELLRLAADDALVVQLDLAALAQMRAQRGRYAVLGDTVPADASLSDLVNPLVLDEVGDAWPLAYGMDPTQRIAGGDAEQWHGQLQTYKQAGTGPLRRLLEATLADIDATEPAFVDWYGRLVATSHKLDRASRSLPISA